MNKAKQLGFSLIELIFVIAIIGVMASLGVSYYQHRTENTKIEKAALQIQTLLQASMAYYADHSKWPERGGTVDPKVPADFKPYIPVGATTNPWGIEFTFYPQGSLFAIDTYAQTKEQATKVAALLPNAIANKNNPNEIEAQATIPGQVVHNEPIIVGMSSYNISDGGDIKKGATSSPVKVYCPANMTASTYSSIQQANFTLNSGHAPQMSATDNPCTDNGFDTTKSLESWSCTVTAKGKNINEMTLGYLEICTPNSST